MACSSPPRLSCIITAFNEGPLVSVSLDSLLVQSFEDYEILLVDDGASECTRSVLHSYDDPRILHIRQANDGLSSARNRALQAARGDYICFLDADDTRPPWAFEAMMDATANNPDCVFSPGVLQELRQETHPFYDQRHFNALRTEGMTAGSEKRDAKALQRALRQLACIEPQSANKMVRRDFLNQYKLRFPSGLFFEDILFHNGVLVNLESYAVTELPTFTYFRRYARAQITSSSTSIRFDAVSTSINTLHLFSRSRYFHDVLLRNLVLAATFKLLKWCGENVSHEHRISYEQAVSSMSKSINPRYLEPPQEKTLAEVIAYAPWVAPSLSYMRTFVG
jgi:glycosyltransferase involved in cell wall biosynthesis